MLYNYTNTAIIKESPLTAYDVAMTLRDLQERSLHNLLISSHGGEFEVVRMGLQYLAPRRITTIAEGRVGSAALGLFLCGERRLALPDSDFVFHEGRALHEGRFLMETEVEAKIEIARLTGQNDVAQYFAAGLAAFRLGNRLVAKLLHDRTNMSYATVYRNMRGDGVTLTAREARRYGFIHEIIDPSCVEV